MSNSAVLTAHPASSARNPTEDACVVPPARSQRTERSAGKGRRRRAAAEQRRAEQQHWSNFSHERDDEIYVAPPRAPVSRRQMRRSTRRMRGDWEVSFHDEDDDNLEIALALSLSLSEPVNGDQAENLLYPREDRPLDMSYESLVMLEDVKCTAPPAFVSRMTGHVFNKSSNNMPTDCMEELCTICQGEYKDKESYMLLPCLHTFHDICGSKWFLNHSKLCPVCKHDVTQEA
ncbi:hypothetical protein GOP47_0025496 [Adiantum capillus-veneris]|uniref:RING-type domain-containing protein n=1 Tax=Adiantum capillus-veneris TaxID=13818 RepID=A0A9D4U0U2_ADICA|nr:hypothetical protein GOP47_0025496 [Adiantum capillus-veneris]